MLGIGAKKKRPKWTIENRKIFPKKKHTCRGSKAMWPLASAGITVSGPAGTCQGSTNRYDKTKLCAWLLPCLLIAAGGAAAMR